MTVGETPRVPFLKSPRLAWCVAGLLLLGGSLLVVAVWRSEPRVTGTVRLDGHPLLKGSIRLIPVDGRSGSDGGAVIRQGKFRIEKGLSEGQYKVEIEATRSVPGKPARNAFDGGVIDAEEAIVFAELNPARISVVRGVNTQDFELKEKKRP
jgi:hypothetical protein